MKKTLLLIASSFEGPGGVACLAAWALQALHEEYDVTLLAWQPQDFALMNARFGTQLPADGARQYCIPARLRRLVAALPLRLALLRRTILERAARRIVRRQSFDLVVSAENEMNIGPPMVQYIHFPWAYYPRPDHDLRWYHPTPLVRLYRGILTAALGYSCAAVAKNHTLVNSIWTGKHYQQWYGAPCQVLYPPAPVAALPRPWDERRDAFICLGRLAPEKRILEIIAILQKVRASGHDISLEICGQLDDPAYYRRIQAAAKAAGNWVRIHLDLPRADLTKLIAGCRYGIHGMIGEHFGIAVAELIRLGCLCFANREGGPAEILADERLLFGSDAEAVQRIGAVLANPAMQAELRHVAQRQGALFSPENFTDGFRKACNLILHTGCSSELK